MSRSPFARNAVEVTNSDDFSQFVPPSEDLRIRSYDEITQPQMIYFDQERAAELLEDVASTPLGRTFLIALARYAGVNTEPYLERANHRAILSQLIVHKPDLDIATIVDLYLPDSDRSPAGWNELHPDQTIVIMGAVTAAKDVQPSRLQMRADLKNIWIYVERDHFLHLNQKYLTDRAIIVAGKVRSVPRSEMRAAAIGTLTGTILSPISGDA